MRRLFLTAGIVLAMLIVQGCFVAQKSLFSSPSVSPTSKAGKDNRVQIQRDDITVRVTAVFRPVIKELVGVLILPPFIPSQWNEEPDPSFIPDKTVIEVMLDPVGRRFTINPMNARIRTADGGELKPEGFIGPVLRTVRRAHGLTRRLHDVCSFGSGEIHTSMTPVPMEEITCFHLIFGRRPYPEMEFALSLEGIENDNKPVAIPMIYFKKASAWVFGVFP